eukprot:PhF_6_TR26669/c1_g2_i2/m.38744
MHRVRALPSDVPRLAMWTELCTSQQDHVDRMLRHDESFKKSVTTAVERGDDGSEKVYLEVRNLMGDKYRVPVENGDVVAAVRIAADVLHMPFSKVLISVVKEKSGDVVGVGPMKQMDCLKNYQHVCK